MKTIVVVRDFHPRPWGRDEKDVPTLEGTGKLFREKILAPALREFDKVHVDLDGYNRYGPSFLDESFGGLIRESNFSPEDVGKKLTYSHSETQSVIAIIDDRIAKATLDYQSKRK